MSVLRNLETKIAGLVEGTFSRVFRSEVRPVEIARKLAREMDEHKTHSVSKTYAPNEYIVYLSPDDRSRLGGYEGDLASELSGYLLEHARREKLALLTRPTIEFRTDDRLNLGEFGIQTRMVRQGEGAQAPVQGDHGHTMVYSTAERLREPLEERVPEHARQAIVVVNGQRLVVAPAGAVLGRSRECDITLDDGNVSRRHAEIRPSGGSWVIADLNSTNGVVVNGNRLDHPVVLRPGDRVELGTTRFSFELE